MKRFFCILKLETLQAQHLICRRFFHLHQVSGWRDLSHTVVSLTSETSSAVTAPEVGASEPKRGVYRLGLLLPLPQESASYRQSTGEDKLG